MAAATKATKSQVRVLRLELLAKGRDKTDVCIRFISRSTVFMVCFVVARLEVCEVIFQVLVDEILRRQRVREATGIRYPSWTGQGD